MANATIRQNLTQVTYALYKSPMNALLLKRQLGNIFKHLVFIMNDHHLLYCTTPSSRASQPPLSIDESSMYRCVAWCA